MPHQYLILVDRRDSEKFRRFKIGKFNAATRDILDNNNLKFIWGFHKGQISDSWKSVRKNDRVFFSIPNNNFKVTGQVAKKITGKRLGKILWPDSLDSQDITHFLLFDAIQQTNLLFTRTLGSTTKKIRMSFPGIYELKKNFKTGLDAPGPKPDPKNISQPKPFVMPDIKITPAQKKLFEVMRFLRDSGKVKKTQGVILQQVSDLWIYLRIRRGKVLLRSAPLQSTQSRRR